jgi:hypothetical protein
MGCGQTGSEERDRGVVGARFSMAERACPPENSVETPCIVPSSVRRGVPYTNPSRLSTPSSFASVVGVGSALIAQSIAICKRDGCNT